MKENKEKPIIWIGTTLEDLRKFPKKVRSDIGYAFDLAQNGDKAENVKLLKGIVSGSGILEIIERFDGDTYRAVYTLRFKDVIYALHAFKKKSKQGKATPKPDMDLIRARYKRAEMLYKIRSER